MSPLIIPGCCFFLIAIFYAILLKRKVLETYFLSSASIIFILFLSGLLNFQGSLLLGYSIIVSFSILSLFYSVKKILKDKNIIKEISLIPSILIMFIFIAFALYLNYGRMFSIWDEFTHWGSSLKNMYFLDALGTFKDSSGFVGGYPPGISLYQYFWMRPFPEFTEFPAYIASNMLFFSIILIFPKKFNLKTVLFILSTLLIPFFLLPSVFTSIYVDSLLGILFGSILLTYFTLQEDNYSLYKFVYISSVVAVLTLMKDTGLIFSVVACIIILIDIFVLQRKETLKYLRGNLKGNIDKIKKLLLLISPLLTTFATYLIWSLHLKLTNAFPAQVEVGNSLFSLFKNLLNNNLLPYQYETILNFKQTLVNTPLLPLDYTTQQLFIILLVLLVLFLFLFRETSPSKKRLGTAIFCSLLGGIFYLVLLLILYISVFSPYEAVRLASYSRYALSYMLGVFFFFLVFFLVELRFTLKKTSVKNNLLYNVRIILITVLLFFFYHYLLVESKDNLKSHIFEARTSVNNSIQLRERYNDILIWEKYFDDENYEPYIISQGTTGFDYIVIIHTLYPTHIKWKQDYSVGLEPYFPQLDDPWTMIITPEEWAKYVIGNYQRLYIFQYDEKFQQIYGHYFDKLENNSFYEVTTNNEGTLELKSLPLP